jgi:hypothetical protein
MAAPKQTLIAALASRIGGKFVLMKDLSSPIFVDGRLWGAFRMGYQ